MIENCAGKNRKSVLRYCNSNKEFGTQMENCFFLTKNKTLTPRLPFLFCVWCHRHLCDLWSKILESFHHMVGKHTSCRKHRKPIDEFCHDSIYLLGGNIQGLLRELGAHTVIVFHEMFRHSSCAFFDILGGKYSFLRDLIIGVYERTCTFCFVSQVPWLCSDHIPVIYQGSHFDKIDCTTASFRGQNVTFSVPESSHDVYGNIVCWPHVFAVLIFLPWSVPIRTLASRAYSNLLFVGDPSVVTAEAH